jgi:hypothetical protein
MRRAFGVVGVAAVIGFVVCLIPNNAQALAVSPMLHTLRQPAIAADNAACWRWRDRGWYPCWGPRWGWRQDGWPHWRGPRQAGRR